MPQTSPTTSPPTQPHATSVSPSHTVAAGAVASLSTPASATPSHPSASHPSPSPASNPPTTPRSTPTSAVCTTPSTVPSGAPSTPAAPPSAPPPASPASSSSSQLARARGGRRVANPHLTDEQRRRERILKNRESAMKSLQKKKRYTQHLEHRAVLLANRNAELKQKIRLQLARLQQMGIVPVPGVGVYQNGTCVRSLAPQTTHIQDVVPRQLDPSQPAMGGAPGGGDGGGGGSGGVALPMTDFSLINSLLPDDDHFDNLNLTVSQ